MARNDDSARLTPAAATPTPPSRALEDTDWKLQRKLKHQQRDAARRSAELRVEPAPKPRFKQHAHHHSGRAELMRLEKNTWLAASPPQSARRSIPDARRRDDKARVSLLSRSGPSAVSWPPTAGGALPPDGLDDDDALEVRVQGEMATSAPSESFLSRSYEGKRGARPLTLFESARIFNESGQLLSHENFDELGSSPDAPLSANGAPKRKIKRRVGRRKNERKRSEATDTMNEDEVVLELMCLLFPELDVGKELNLLFLGGGQMHEDVFHFDEDDPVDRPRVGSAAASVLDIDLLKFQAALTTMLFQPNELPQEMPARGTTADALVELYLTPQWLAHQMFNAVKLDVLAQYDRFAVAHAIFRAFPDKRVCVLEAATFASLAIFQHQRLDSVSDDACKPFVSIQGTVAFLKAALGTIESDARSAPDVFGSSPEQIDESIGGLCFEIMRAVRLLARSSPGGSGRSDENRNQLEKYAECSDSAEATTYRALGEVIYRMAAFSPMHGEAFLSWMLLKWPQRNVQLQLFFVRFTAGLLKQFMQCGLMFPPEVVRRTFARVASCIQSPHFLVAQEACNLCGDLQLMDVYLSRNQALREKIASALHANSTGHWNARIREISDEHFDMLLDLA